MEKVNNAKKTVQVALRSEYGFKPSLNDIVIISSKEEENRTVKADFMVNGKHYKFDSYIMYVGKVATVWCGSGTITKIN